MASALMRAKSAVLLKSSVLSVALASSSSRFSTFVLTTSTIEFNAASNASASLAPEPSAAAAKALTTLMI